MANKNNAEKAQWSAEKYGMRHSAILLTGRNIPVLDVAPPNENEIGYTSSEGTIHIAYSNPIMDGLSNVERSAFRKGVFAHELLHQIFTNFKAFEEKLKTYRPVERQIFSTFNNILEDPAIEYWAPSVIGGPLLSSLKFTIAYCYKKSMRIDSNVKDKDGNEVKLGPLEQLICALINFGDMGLVKGNFTDEKAKKIFAKIAPIFEKGIKEANCEKRIEYSAEIMKLAKPLWKDEVKKLEDLQKLDELLKKLNKNAATGSGSGRDGDSDSRPGSDAKDKRRKITIKKVSKEELEDLKKSGSISDESIPDSGDITVLVCDEETADGDEGKNKLSIPGNDKSKKESKDDEKSKANGNKSKDSDSKDDSDSEKSEKNDKSDSDDNSENSSEKSDDNAESSKETNPMDGSKDSEFRSDGQDSTFKPSNKESESSESDECGEIDESEYWLDEKDIKAIEAMDTKDAESMKQEEEQEKADTSDVDDFDITSPKMSRKRCLNNRVCIKESDLDKITLTYSAILDNLSPMIKTLTRQLKTLFMNDAEEKEHRMSGNINFHRLNSGTMTSRVFDRVKAPYEKSNLAVMLLVDESGSMGSYKSRAARECCIALSETFKNLNVPLYVMGFTADTLGYDVVHNHYITWKNTKNDRLKLVNICARCDNCDGYSIRYATEVLKKNKAKNKLLIVISDGQPAAYNYDNGVSDTADAIRDAKKHISVLGVAIGNSDTETIYGMYKNDFFHISNVDQLFSGMAKKLKDIIKKWE